MISYEIYCRMKHLHQHDGLSVGQIAQELALHTRTVSVWLKKKNYTPRPSVVRASKLDPYKDTIKSWLAKHDYSATQILQRLRECGFAGQYSIVKRYVRQIRPRRAPAYLTLSFAPGECAQVDWGNYGTIGVGSTTRKLSFFVMVLCYSRMLYVEFCVRETMEHFLGCHQNAFEFFQGVPRKIMVDNLRSAILQRLTGEAPVFNPRYLDLANHYGFSIAPCNLGKGNEKGRVENGVGYVKKNFLRGLEMPDFSLIHPEARNWLEQIANTRLHGETKKRPIDMFEMERTALQPLAHMPYDIGIVHTLRASSRFRIVYDTNRYSVPAEYASARLTVKTYPDRICAYANNNLIARHPRSYDRHLDFEHPDHPKELLLQRKKARDQKLFMRFLSLSPKAEEYYQQLQQRRFNSKHHVQKIVALSEIYGTEPLRRAIDDAFTFQAFSCEYIANILEQRSRLLPQPQALSLTRRQDLLEIDLPEPNLDIYEKS